MGQEVLLPHPTLSIPLISSRRGGRRGREIPIGVLKASRCSLGTMIELTLTEGI
jgi:hypothetical protein